MLDNAYQPSAAQDFLDKKLSSNKYNNKNFDSSRYTESQLAALDQFGGPSTANKPEYQKVVTNQAEMDATSDKRRGIAKEGDLSHYGNMYESGQWGTGESSADDLAKKYNLDRSQADSPDNRNVDAGHIWGKDASGKDVYIGKANMDIGGNQDLIASHATQLYGDEEVHKDTGGSLDTFGDIQGALLAEWDGGGPAPTAIEGDKEVEFSPEIQQAKERVATYENDVSSGKLADDVYNDSYSFNPNKGSQGIGTPSSGDTLNKATQASQSFLQNKKEDIDKKYQFTSKYK